MSKAATREGSRGTAIAPLECEEWKGSVDKNAEPEISHESDIPSDGADHEGEAEIRKITPKPELSTPPDNARK